SAAKPAPDSMMTLAPVCRQLVIARTAGGEISSAAGTISKAQREGTIHRASARVHCAPALVSADAYPETDSRKQPRSFKSRSTHRRLVGSSGSSLGSPAVTAPVARSEE